MSHSAELPPGRDERDLRRFLDLLEEEEARRLVWGVVDAGFDQFEALDLARKFLHESGQIADEGAADEILEALIERRLLFEFPGLAGTLLRTRSAEALRLTARLRQIFPGRSWETAPTLVADYRYQLAPRRYPRRTITPEQTVDRLHARGLLRGRQRASLAELLSRDRPQSFALAEFQVSALETALSDVEAAESRGMVVCAGTGTGKTLAFYLPALVVAADLVRRDEHFVKALALYPRNELLKDQFASLYNEARRLDGLLRREAGRAMTIGAFFGPTPKRAHVDDVKASGWSASGNGFVCPYVRCPRCGSEMIWRASDLAAERETLACSEADCPVRIASDEIRLTRRSILAHPPDILVTTTEMLNRRIADRRAATLLGIGVPEARRPRMLLVDEAHLYDGVHGAQVAYLLRRYRHAVGGRIHTTGLSATLREAGAFFASLVGLPDMCMREIGVGPDLEEEGREYRLAIRGDPASGASLLSTTIQTCMLLGRVLEPLGSSVTRGAFGNRAFAFTDDLDVTNRLYHDFLDAEGRDSFGHPRADKRPLAALRAQSAGSTAERLRAGQWWRMCEEVGRRGGVGVPLRIGRTSSQDAGVDREADVIVATASLEVGYDDSRVGAVIQHKAPRDAASFLQRRGRAGRPREMRPWIVVVLSDFGRDRLAYQSYDVLFDPQLDERRLPTANRHVQRMQAVYAFFDYLARTEQDGLPAGAIWDDLSGPAEPGTPWAASRGRRQAWIAAEIDQLLADPSRRAALESHLRGALGIGPEDLDAVLWEPPRSLLMGALPTLLRRLRSGWRRVTPGEDGAGRDFCTPFAPLPDFVPQNLFSDLNLPEVVVRLPPDSGRAVRTEALAVTQALSTFAAGRVTRRFGVAHARLRHWVAPPQLAAGGSNALPVESFCPEIEELGLFQHGGGHPESVRCVRPLMIAPTAPPAEIGSTSNARLIWRSQIFPVGEGWSILHVPPGSWGRLVREVRALLHGRREHAEIRRFALGSNATVKFARGGGSREYAVQFTDRAGTAPAAIGFVQPADAIVFRWAPPPDFRVAPDDPDQAKVRAFRAAYFRSRVHANPSIAAVANVFERDRLIQISFAALAARAIERGERLDATLAALDDKGLSTAILDALERIFGAADLLLPEDDETEPDDDIGGDSGPTAGEPRVARRLREILSVPGVVAGIRAACAALTGPTDSADARSLALARLRATLGGALLEACRRLCPHLSQDDLVVDVDPGPRPEGLDPLEDGVEEIWVSESALGGGGAAEEVARRIADDPRRFLRLAESALGPSDFEVVDEELRRALSQAASDAQVGAAFARVRGASGHAASLAADVELRRTLVERGLNYTTAVGIALRARVLRPGSSEATDGLLHELIERWQAAETMLGVEVDARVFAYVESANQALDVALRSAGVGVPGDRTWRMQAIHGLLWPRGSAVRVPALASWNPFAPPVEADRLMLLDVLGTREPAVSCGGVGASASLRAILGSEGSAAITAPHAARSLLKSMLIGLAVDPVDVGFRLAWPLVDAVARDDVGLRVRLRMEEGLS